MISSRGLVSWFGRLMLVGTVMAVAACSSTGSTSTPNNTDAANAPGTALPSCACSTASAAAVPLGSPGPALPTVARGQSGTVLAWGDDSAGQIDVPAGLSGVVSVAAGGLFRSP